MPARQVSNLRLAAQLSFFNKYSTCQYLTGILEEPPTELFLTFSLTVRISHAET
jgi:hypothetical protein